MTTMPGLPIHSAGAVVVVEAAKGPAQVAAAAIVRADVAETANAHGQGKHTDSGHLKNSIPGILEEWICGLS